MNAFGQILGVVCVALWVTMTGCGSDEQDEAADQTELEKMEAEVLELIGDATCSDVSECRYIAFGAKPCGGPWRYLVYSATSVDTIAVAEAVAAYNARNDQLNRRWGWISDCGVPPSPQLDCVDGRCVDVRE